MQFHAPVLCTALFLVACGGPSSSEADPASPGPSSPATKAKFTKYAPQYPDSQVMSCTEMAMANTKLQVIVLRTKDEPAKIVSFYQERAAAAGVTTKVIDGPNGTVIMLSGPELPALAGASISINPSTGLPGLTLMLPLE